MLFQILAVKLSRNLARLRNDRGGNFGIIMALLIPLLIVVAGGVVDIVWAMGQKVRFQDQLDAAVLAAVHETAAEKQLATATSYIREISDSELSAPELLDAGMSLALVKNADGSLTGTLRMPHPTAFLKIIHLDNIPISVSSTAIKTGGGGAGAGCIYALGNKNQAVLINSGAKLDAKQCEVHVHSTSSPAFIMNAGATIDTAKFCVKGTSYIQNGGTLSNLQIDCDVAADPYAGKIPEPAVPASCTTQGALSGTTFTLNPGVHCDTTFNGNPTVTFKPGLHIIKGRMILNSGSTVIAEGVTFYYPDVYSEIRANGSLKFTASAPLTGDYAGVLMFEKTSNAANNANKQQYVFNGSLGETLTGIIHLPNRDATYNSTTNQTSKISLVVNTMIMNSANWKLSPYDGPGPAGAGAGAGAVRLVN
ncbi:MAG: pilus assembly protein [Hoeflea sp.]|nr:pilus assembly protein [Alphaproteobacteria bacterium]MBV1722479.1 pilus assembly protein [Hoeflea sp.]MBU4543213.1 pilus assembly protein [Alphaproteobacteria bacterium]MBU4550247.1 pilus assembly protein [Alphaproteobacteria bacterium]MBV1761629.1 pilus assembly protein [Hoeflea sp.]